MTQAIPYFPRIQIKEDALIVCYTAIERTFAPNLPSTRMLAAMKRGGVKACPAALGAAAGATHAEKPGHAADFVLYSRSLVLERDGATIVVCNLHVPWSEPQRVVRRVPAKRPLQMSVWKRRRGARTVPGKSEQELPRGQGEYI